MIELYDEKGNIASMYLVVDWWLERYIGMEHLAEGGQASPETLYTINTILERCFKQLKSKHKVKKNEVGRR